MTAPPLRNRCNAHLILESEAEGCHLTRGPGVIVEIAIPPGQVRNLHIISCNCDTPTLRRPGFTRDDWRESPPWRKTSVFPGMGKV